MGGGEILPFRAEGTAGTASAPRGAVSATVADPRVISVVNAHLPSLPSPLRLAAGPLLVTLESWSDGTVVASLPVCGLWADADSDTRAIRALSAEISAFVTDVQSILACGRPLGGELAERWTALSALVHVPPSAQSHEVG